jgi:hypothetical protein
MKPGCSEPLRGGTPQMKKKGGDDDEGNELEISSKERKMPYLISEMQQCIA